MSDFFEYIAVLRCRTYHMWPEREVFEQQQISFEDGGISRRAKLAVLAFSPRLAPELYTKDETKQGALLWDGEIKDLHLVRNHILKAPEDEIPVGLQHRKPYRGEIDICVQFRVESEVKSSTVEAARAVAYSTMATINLQLGEHLVPTVPFQIMRVISSTNRQMDNTVHLSVVNRVTFQRADVLPVIRQFGALVGHAAHGPRMLVALELYAAHFGEAQARVRFLLLVIAIEAIAEPTAKHEIATSLLARWQEELREQLSGFEPGSDEHHSLIALEREMFHRKVDSIRSQVRNLFGKLGSSNVESQSLQKRALHVYDRRSALVHDGYLPAGELGGLENDARELLELVLKNTISQLEP
jgi:hypothetical protein